MTGVADGGEIESLLAISTKKDKDQFISQFQSPVQIDILRKSEKCKYIGRNMLGLRKFDDWIHALEIGNIMHLNPLTTQELHWNGATTSNSFTATTQQNSNAALNRHQEFQKDPMLKKLVLLVVALFSIATEMRMMVQFGKKNG